MRPKSIISLVCDYCRVAFDRPAKEKRGRHTYCSRVCYRAAHALPPRLCAWCGATIDPRTKCRRFCNMTCLRKSHAPTDERRFLGKVRMAKGTACWEWQGKLRPGGYGEINVARRAVLAHRYSYMRAYACTPLPGFYICHHCDNPACVRPDHLYIGTAKDNNRDAMTRGRAAVGYPGEQSRTARLTTDQVLEIRRLRTHKLLPRRVIAQRYGISENYVSVLHHRGAWRHI